VIGPGPYNRDVVVIDEHTGTQFDAPAHFVPPPDSGYAGAGPMGLVTGDKVPVWRLVGEACVIDVRDHIDDAAKGESYLIMPETVIAWEKKNRKLGPGDVVLFRSGYTDSYYKPFPQGERFVADVLAKKASGWPAPSPETMKLLGEREVFAAGTDGASMGPNGPIAVGTHQAGGQYGLVWTECSTNLGKLPVTGAFHAILANKHAAGSGGETRALAITEPKLAAKLVASAKAKKVADLTVLLDEDVPVTWPGEKPGLEGARYLGKTLNAFDPARGPFFARMHILDSQAGTHLVTPSFALPPKGFDNASYAPEVRETLAKYEAKWGKRGTSDATVDKIPLDSLVGPARVIDVRDLVEGDKGTPGKSPAITLDHVKQAETKDGPLAAGDVVIFRSGYSDQFWKKFPEGERMMVQPLAGKAPGWPTPDLEVIDYLAKKGVRLIATDSPTLGGVDQEHAEQVYWLTGTKGLNLVEYLTGLEQIPATGGFFLFGPIKLEGAHGGYGRAIALY
jgi:kynurenine formamidase